MLAALSASPLGLLTAFGAGMLSFLSPCVLPLVPGYVSMVSGLSAAELVGRQGDVGARGSRRQVMRGILLFIAGFTVVFTTLGAAASGIGHLLGTDRHAFTTAAGAVVVAFGVVLAVGAVPATVWARGGSLAVAGVGRIVQERRIQVRPSALGSWAPPVMGMAFAFGWTPCIGPVLGAVLGLAASRTSLGDGVVLLMAYSLGLGVPFLLTGMAFGRLTSLFARARRRIWIVHLAGGAVLVAFGVLLLTGQLGWLAAQVSDLMRHLGLQRLTTS